MTETCPCGAPVHVPAGRSLVQCRGCGARLRVVPDHAASSGNMVARNPEGKATGWHLYRGPLQTKGDADWWLERLARDRPNERFKARKEEHSRNWYIYRYEEGYQRNPTGWQYGGPYDTRREAERARQAIEREHPDLADGRLYAAKSRFTGQWFIWRTPLRSNPTPAAKDAARARYRRFHGTEPRRAVELDRKLPDTWWLLGEGDGASLSYVPPDSSQHSGAIYEHKWGDLGGRRQRSTARYLISPDGTAILILGNFKVTERGIVG